MKVEQETIQKFLDEHGTNPARWVIPIGNKDLKEISVAAFQKIHNIEDPQSPDSPCGPRLIFYNECHYQVRNYPVFQRIHR